MGFPLETRRELLQDALQKVTYPVLHCVPFNAKPVDLIRAAKELELEGVVAKRKGSRYEPGRRSAAWLKFQLKRSQEFVIGGYTLGSNPFDALVAAAVVVLPWLIGVLLAYPTAIAGTIDNF